jgi:hypothetical protein
MKKKLAVLLAAAMLTLGAAANAMASWADGDLIRVVYNHAGTVEVATDLGNVNNVIATNTMSSSAFSLSQITGATSFSDLYVAYFAKQASTSGNNGIAWVGIDSASTTAPVTGSRKFLTLVNAIQSMGSYYNSINSAVDQVVAQQSNTNSYNTTLNPGGVTGILGGYIPAGVEQSLAALATGGTVSTTLYSFVNQGGTSGVSTGTATPLTLAVNNSGVTTSATPIPPSFLLMGSGLIGMIGIRRRLAA